MKIRKKKELMKKKFNLEKNQMNLKMHDYISKGQSRNKTISYNQNLKEKLKHFHHKELITELEFQSFKLKIY